MAEGGKSSFCNTDMVENQIMDYSDPEVEIFNNVWSTENRLWSSGRGSGWKQRRQTKRKKVSSTDSTDSIDIKTFSGLKHDDKLSFLFEYVSRNLTTQNGGKTEQTTFSQTIKELRSYVDILSEQARANERDLQHQAKCMKMLAYKSIDTEAKNRRNNLIVWGVSERGSVRDDLLVLNFFEDEMAIDTSDIVIDSAKRIGTKASQRNIYQYDPKRPILVRFRDLSDTERVMQRAFKLKGTPFGIDRDYPREIANARRALYKSEEARQARVNRNRLQIRYPAKLLISGSVVCDKFPEWEKYLYMSRTSCFDLDTKVDCEIASSSSKSTILNNRSETAYDLDTADEITSESSEEEQRHDGVFTEFGSRDERSGAKDTIAFAYHLRNEQLSSDRKQTNKASRDSVYKSSGKNKVKPLPKSKCSQRKTSEVDRKSAHKNKYSTPKCVTKSVNPYDKVKTSHEFNTHVRKSTTQPVIPRSKSGNIGKPQHICNWYGDVGLIASDDCDTQL